MNLQSVKVVRSQITADDCVAVLADLREASVCYPFGYGWTYKGGVYVVYVETNLYRPEVAALAIEVLSKFDSAGTEACAGCRHREACSIDPNQCGYWL